MVCGVRPTGITMQTIRSTRKAIPTQPRAREGEDCWTIECAGYCYHSSERIRSPRRITRTSQDERIGTSQDFCCTESALGKNKGPQGCPDQSRQATYFSSGISEYQSGNYGTMGEVEGSQ